jgi:hypothetical protein
MAISTWQNTQCLNIFYARITKLGVESQNIQGMNQGLPYNVTGKYLEEDYNINLSMAAVTA